MVQQIGIKYNDDNSPMLTWLWNDSNKYRCHYGTGNPTGDLLIDLSPIVESGTIIRYITVYRESDLRLYGD